MHFDVDAWCIIAVCGVSAFTVVTQAILQRKSGFPRDCLRGGRVPKLAGLPTPWAKDVFILFFSKHKGFSCEINVFKNKNTSYEIVWISWHM